MSVSESIPAKKAGLARKSILKKDAEGYLSKAKNIYNIDGWGQNYFDINELGHVIVRPLHDEGASIDLIDIVKEAKSRNLQFPLLVRFQDILRHRNIRICRWNGNIFSPSNSQQLWIRISLR